MPSSTSSSEAPRARQPIVVHPVRALVVTAVCTVVLLVVSEAIARRLAPPARLESMELFHLDPGVGFLLARNHVYPGFEWFGEFVERPMHTNSRGLKGIRDYPAPKAENELRILCFGDSTTNNMYNDSWPEFLERLMDDALPGKTVWVQNAGLSGFSSENVWRLAEREIPAFRPDVVIFNIGTNEAGMTNRPDSADFDAGSFGAFIARAGQYSRLVTWVRRQLPASLIEPWRNVPGTAVDRNDTPRVSPEGTRENLRRMIQAARRADALPVVTLYPWLFWNESDNWMPAMADYPPYIRAIYETASEEGAVIVNLIRLLDREDRAAFWVVLPNPAVPEFGLMIENYHLNLAGTELAAAEFARVILPAIAESNPDMQWNEQPLQRIFEKFSVRPRSTPGLLDMVPPDDLYEHVSERMRRSNAAALERTPLPHGLLDGP